MDVTKSLLTAAQNNAIRTNHIKARIDKMQQNSKCWLYGDRDETIHHVISECSKLAQKLEFDPSNKWHLHNTTSVLENDTHKLLWYFETQTGHQISARRPDLIIIKKKKKKNLQNC